MLSQGLGLALSGVVIGTLGALALNRLVEALLFEVRATDPIAFSAVDFLFVLVALAASFLPAWRAAKIDPMTALLVG